MAEAFQSLVDLLQKSSAKFPHHPLFGTKTGGTWRWITYDEFRKDTDRFRAALAGLGIGRGDRVAIAAANSVEWAIAAHATFGLGAIFVPMYESQSSTEWEFILRDSGARLVIGSTRAIHAELLRLKERLPGLEQVLGMALHDSDPWAFRSILVRGGAAPVPALSPSTDDVAFFIYTSGTTGQPRGVVLTHGNICSNVNAVQGLFPFFPDERSLAFLPWAHAFGQTCELHTLMSLGSSIAINDDVNRLLENLAEVRPTVLYAVPRVWNRIYDGVQGRIADQPAPVRALFRAGLAAAAKRSRGARIGFVEQKTLDLAERVIFSRIRARFGGRLRLVISGSAALSTEVAELIDAIGIQIYEGYGLTETSPIATTNYPGSRKLGSVGRTIPGVRIQIDTTVEGAGGTGPTRGAGPIGEIIVQGPNVMRGYHGQPEEDARVFTADHALRTGDLGYLDADGFLFLTGRIKELFKLENGRYVAPVPVEEELKLSPYITSAVLYGANRPFTVALLVVDRAAVAAWATARRLTVIDPTTDDHVQHLLQREVARLAARFKPYERPERFLVTTEDFTTDNGLLTPTLKVRRTEVLERYGKALERLY